jgi:hypothetical protein
VTGRMKDSHAYNFAQLRSSPPAAMSAASSQYYRSADAHSHYAGFPANSHEHVYGLASWHQDANHASYAGPPSAPFLHYPQAGVESVSHPSSSAAAAAPQPWAATYSRQGLPGCWGPSGGDDSYASRTPPPYHEAAEGSAPGSRQNLQAPRQYQHGQTLRIGQNVPLISPGQVYRSTSGLPELRASSVRGLDMPCLRLIRD